MRWDATVVFRRERVRREPSPRPARERFFKQGVGPSKWLMVVVDSEKEPPGSVQGSILSEPKLI
jgi:hypothetical protein